MTSLERFESPRTLQPFEIEICRQNRPKAKKSFRLATRKDTHSNGEQPIKTLNSEKREQSEPSNTQVWSVRQGGIFTKAQQISKSIR
jgi:hypothetical protein